VAGSSFLPVGMMSKCFRTAKSSLSPSGKVILRRGSADEPSLTHSKDGSSAGLPKAKPKSNVYISFIAFNYQLKRQFSSSKTGEI
jgi:hypothetical protein